MIISSQSWFCLSVVICLFSARVLIAPPVFISSPSGKWTFQFSRQPPPPYCQEFHHILILLENHPKTLWPLSDQTIQTKLHMQKAKKINSSERKCQKRCYLSGAMDEVKWAEQKLQPTVTLSQADQTDLGRRRRSFLDKQTLCLWCSAPGEVWPAPPGFWTPLSTPPSVHLSRGSQSHCLQRLMQIHAKTEMIQMQFKEYNWTVK